MKLQQILESLSSIVYHYSKLQNAIKIIDNGYFLLSNSLGDEIEGGIAPSGYNYYLSTTRSKLGIFHTNAYKMHGGVLFVLDGEYYKNNFKAKPVSYWGGRIPLGGDEAEDRIFSKTNKLPIDGIKEVHVLITSDKSKIDSYQFLINCKKHNIITFVYNNEKDWLLQNKNKTIPVSSLKTTSSETKSPPFKERNSSNQLSLWVELLFKKKVDDLSPRAKEIILNFNNPYTYNKLVMDMGYGRKQYDVEYPLAVKIIDFMNKNKLKTIKELFDNVRDKWKTITDNKKE
jgi:hypothetical protein